MSLFLRLLVKISTTENRLQSYLILDESLKATIDTLVLWRSHQKVKTLDARTSSQNLLHQNLTHESRRSRNQNRSTLVKIDYAQLKFVHIYLSVHTDDAALQTSEKGELYFYKSDSQQVRRYTKTLLESCHPLCFRIPLLFVQKIPSLDILPNLLTEILKQFLFVYQKPDTL